MNYSCWWSKFPSAPHRLSSAWKQQHSVWIGQSCFVGGDQARNADEGDGSFNIVSQRRQAGLSAHVLNLRIKNAP